MKCNRLITLIKNWYLQVQSETMAPARMVEFMELHLSKCEDCLEDPDVKTEVDKIREIVLPPSKALRSRETDSDEDEPEGEGEGEDLNEEDESSLYEEEPEVEEDMAPDIV